VKSIHSSADHLRGTLRLVRRSFSEGGTLALSCQRAAAGVAIVARTADTMCAAEMP
jgi:hypothetical protein